MELPASVIVPTRNRHGFVRDLVVSIGRGTDVPAEIVVVDQSDVPDENLLSLDSGCVIVHRPLEKVGASAARNEGIRVAANDVLVFVDDDVIAAEGWLRSLVTTLRHGGERTVVSGFVAAGTPEADGAFAPSLKSDGQGAVYEGRAAANVLWSGNMALFRSAVDEIGLFDERLGPGKRRFPGGGEDNDYCFRLLEAGYRIVYEPQAVVYHRAWRPPSEYVATQWRYGRGQGGFYAKHMHVRDRYILAQCARHVLSCVTEAIRAVRRPRVAAGSAAYAAGIVTATAEWLVTQRFRGR
jgi:GT2 family glycosyltransferase